MRLLLPSIIVAVAGGAAFLGLAGVEKVQGDSEKAHALTVADEKFLGGLIKQFLFDRQGTERVRVRTFRRTAWATRREVTRDGWLVAGQAGQPARIFFTDGESILAPANDAVVKIDFLADCRVRFSKAEKPDSGAEADERFRIMDQEAIGLLEDSDLCLAAWLLRLGQRDLAAKGLARGRKAKDDELTRLRKDLAWSAFAAMVHAYMVRADGEALEHGERLLRLYPEEDW